MVDSGGATHIPDELVGERLKGEVELLLEDSMRLKDMSTKSLHTARPDASSSVVNVCREVMK